jgi:hypothetical protein
VLANTSVLFARLPLFAWTKNGTKTLPRLSGPWQSPVKKPPASGAVRMSNDVGVTRCSPPHVWPPFGE